MFTANQGAMGRAMKRLSARRRKLRIHWGSLFISDISRTISSERPFLGLKT